MASFMEPIRSLFKRRELLWQFLLRNVKVRHRGSVLGALWLILNPLLMLGLYVFAFGVVFGGRFTDSPNESTLDFALGIFLGLNVLGLVSGIIGASPGIIVGQPNFVKKVVFPLEALPWVTVISAFFQGVISTGILLAYLFFIQGGIPWTAVLFPIPLFVLAFVCIAAGWLISATAVYLKDIAQMMGLLSTVLFFMAPILYPKTALPVEFQNLLYLNPLTYIIEQFRAVVLWGELPNWNGLALYGIASVAIAWMSLAWFQKTRKGFADVL